jgi:hypothetical protein
MASRIPPADDRIVVDTPEVVALAARKHSRGELVRLRRREDEDGVGRGLFERLQERVVRPRRKHVHFVEEIHLPFQVGRREGNPVAQLPDVVDAAVAGGVHLDKVECRTGKDGPAGGAVVAGFAALEV